MGIYLGLDSSTQSLSALIIDTHCNKVIYEQSVNFGKDLEKYNSPNGFIENQNPLIRHAHPLMWVDALDLLFKKMKKDNFDLSSIDCISGSGQQHGSVYLNKNFLTSTDWSGSNLSTTIAPMLSRKTAPIWMDSSTTLECDEIAKALNGKQVVCSKTGSIPIERFTGPQIRKFYKEEPDAYKNTAVIHLVSSFMASILAGKSVGIDYADGAGMNLLNLNNLDWDSEMLNATAPDLKNKLPEAQPSNSVVGNIAGYFVRTYGFSEHCKINIWSGDNPNSLVGLGAGKAGTAVISLGTSDTFMAAFKTPVTDKNGFGHVFCNPAGGYMCLICFKNGSLAREKVKDEFNLNWNQFDVVAFEDTPPGNHGNMMIPFYLPEITPKTKKAIVEFFGDENFKSKNDFKVIVRSIVESQITNMKLHSNWIDIKLEKIRITGGASSGNAICQIVANIFQADVERFSVSNSAGLGAAIRAANADTGISMFNLADDLTTSKDNKIFHADSSLKETYENFAKDFAKIQEKRISC
jgi:xylulokinase